MTTGHRRGDPVRYRTDLEIFDGAGGLRSTAADLVKYMAAHVGEPQTDLERAMRFAVEVRDTVGEGGAGRGLAWATVVQPGEAPVIVHGGGTVGYSSVLAVMPDRATGLVLLANDAAFDDNLALTLLYPDPPPAEWEPVSVDPAVLVRYAGEDGAMEMVMAVDQREPSAEGRVTVARRVGDSAPPPARVAGNVGRFDGTATRWALLALALLVSGVAAFVGLRRLRMRGGGHATR